MRETDSDPEAGNLRLARPRAVEEGTGPEPEAPTLSPICSEAEEGPAHTFPYHR